MTDEAKQGTVDGEQDMTADEVADKIEADAAELEVYDAHKCPRIRDPKARKLFEDAYAYGEMTATPGWQRLYLKMKECLRGLDAEYRDVDKPRALALIQGSEKALRDLILLIKGTANEIEHMRTPGKMFGGQRLPEMTWDDESGVLAIGAMPEPVADNADADIPRSVCYECLRSFPETELDEHDRCEECATSGDEEHVCIQCNKASSELLDGRCPACISANETGSEDGNE